MIDLKTQVLLKKAISSCIVNERGVLDALRKEILPLREATQRILPRSLTSMSLVGTDGGNNQLRFDPFLIQLVRVVDSSNNDYSLEAISSRMSIRKLSESQFDSKGKPCTPLGRMMKTLDVDVLQELSSMIRLTDGGDVASPRWVQVYRELVEWATLLDIFRKDFGTDTLIVFDGLLRSKIFSGDLFNRLLRMIRALIKIRRDRDHRRLYLVGVAKHSKVLSRYRLAMALERVLQTDYPAYVEVPREVEERAYHRSDFARGDDLVREGEAMNKFVGGKMYLVKFGSRHLDPVWPIDIFVPQIGETSIILSALLSDAINGFPVPHYPRCLQKAHENAALVDFDLSILQDFVYNGVRSILGDEGGILDAVQLQDTDPAQYRYG